MDKEKIKRIVDDIENGLYRKTDGRIDEESIIILIGDILKVLVED